MSKKPLFLLLILFAVQAYAQDKIKSYVQQHKTDIRTVSPDSLNFSDLEVIGNAIGDSRIVMLGEQDHGDAPAFLAKTRLIKYLHEKKGFNVLAFESDFLSLNEGWEKLDKNKAAISNFLVGNIFTIWTKAQQCDDLFNNYVPATYQTNNPLIMTGFDCQLHGRYSAQNLKKIVDSFLRSQDLPFTKTEAYRSTFLPFVDSTMISKNVASHAEFTRQLELIINKIEEKDSTSMEMMVLKSLYAQSNAGILYIKRKSGYLDFRDNQMAENLKWLAQKKYPNEKIIVWAHNMHVLKNPQLIKGLQGIKKTMGEVFTEDKTLEESTYILGFASKQGTAGRLSSTQKHYTVDRPNRNGFETWMPENTSLAFVDFKKYRLENPSSKEYFEMKGKSHQSSSAIWTNVFDGVFYIRDMYPTDQLN